MGILGKFTGKCCDSKIFNNNDMFLSKELFQNVKKSQEYKDAIERGHYIGFLGHPEDPGCQDFEHACIVMTDMNVLDSGDVTGDFNLIDTPVGRIVKAFIDAGVHWGISIRGAGDVDGEGKVDPDTFVFRGFDLVAFPAYNDCMPEFKEIAASSDLDKKVKYKKVCTEIKKNLSAITSTTALDIIQEQFNEGTDEYVAIEERKNELGACNEDECCEDIIDQKIAGLTDLYLEKCEEVESLKAQLADVGRALNNESIECARRIKSIKRISNDQMDALKSENEHLYNKQQTSVAAAAHLKKQNAILASKVENLTEANNELSSQVNKYRSINASNSSRFKVQSDENSKLQKELESVKAENLKYKQKIDANSEIICKNNSTISDLKGQLSKTVAAKTSVEGRVSNLDDTVKGLKAKVEAAEQMVYQYQQAYANMYANALGVSISNLPISASTSVQDLQSLITGGTSTSGIAASPAFYDANDEMYDDNSDEFFIGPDGDMVTL